MLSEDKKETEAQKDGRKHFSKGYSQNVQCFCFYSQQSHERQTGYQQFQERGDSQNCKRNELHSQLYGFYSKEQAYTKYWCTAIGADGSGTFA